MRVRNGIVFLLLLLAAENLLLSPCAGQLPIEPAQLPARAVFYLLWRGTPTGEVRNNNVLYALWDDPDFASARTSFAEMLLNNAQNRPGQKDKPAPSVWLSGISTISR